MGVLNLTPDSFFDGGRYLDHGRALAHAERMIEEGADIIDIGGESTRPGAADITEAEELARVLPVVEAVRLRFRGMISVDTSRAPVMRAAVAAGADLINDIRALRLPGALQAVRDLDVPVCLMHMQGEPRNMQAEPRYSDVLADVAAFLRERAHACIGAGVRPGNILLDPGFGFGKTLEHNLTLMRELRQLADLGFPLLVGVSRKSMIGALTGQPVDRRVHGSVALAVYATLQGASIVRVHDVGATVDALRAIAPLVPRRPE